MESPGPDACDLTGLRWCEVAGQGGEPAVREEAEVLALVEAEEDLQGSQQHRRHWYAEYQFPVKEICYTCRLCFL